MARRNHSAFSRILNRLVGRATRKSTRRDAALSNRSLRAEQLEARRVFAGLVFDSVLRVESSQGAIYTSDVAVDGQGNTYMGGQFSGEVDFDRNAAHSGNVDVVTARGRGDGFVAKYGTSGQLQWVRRIGGDSPETISDDRLANIEVNAAGDVYISGNFSQTADFGALSRSSVGLADAYVAKLDLNGNVLWVNTWGTGNDEAVDHITLDSAGQLTAAGQSSVVSPAQLFLRQFDSSGNLNWAQEQFSASNKAMFSGLQASADGGTYVLGSFNGTVDLDPTSGELLSTGTTGNPNAYNNFDNAFVTKLSSSGQFQWATSYVADAESSVRIHAIAVSDEGSVFTTGRYHGSISINGPDLNAAGIPDSNSSRMFFSNISPAGELLGLRSYDWITQSATRIAATGDSVLVMMNFANSLNLESGLTLQSPTGKNSTAFIQMSSDLEVLSAFSNVIQYSYNNLTTDTLGNVYIPGWTSNSPTDYDPNPNTTHVVVSSTGTANGSVVKLKPVFPGDNVRLLDGDFEPGEWDYVWQNDAQLDWFRSTQRATSGSNAAEVDGLADNATLTTANVIDLSSMQSATLTFDWLIESGFDAGEHLALDVSTNAGNSWIQNVRRLNGNVSTENVWHSETVDLTPYKSAALKVRFRSTVSAADEDANVDNVRIVGIADGPNSAPVAVAGGFYSMDEGSSVVLSGAGSSDPDGSIASYAWDLDNDGQYDDASGVTVNFATTVSGVTSVGLQVTDNRGATAVTTVSVTVNNVAPTANAGSDLNGYVGTPLGLSAAASSDPGQDIVSYLWDLNNDGFYDDATGISATFTSAAAGIVTGGLKVIDADGAIAYDSLTITIDLVPVLSTKFYVVDDASTDRTFEYTASGTAVENYGLGSGNTAPRGAASTAAGDKVWVVDANKKVYVYNEAGVLLGSWTAGSMASTATIEGITTDGTDIWLVDARQDRVYRYAGAAGRLSGSQNAASSFALNKANLSPKDLVTDGTNIWVVNDSSTDKVFKYTLTGALVGSWTIASANSSPTGLTLDPSGASQSIWIVDRGTDHVYEYTHARSRNSGSQSAAVWFALAAGNGNPQGIADPPVSVIGQAEVARVATAVGLNDAAIAELSIEPSSVPMIDARRLAADRSNHSASSRISALLEQTTALATNLRRLQSQSDRHSVVTQTHLAGRESGRRIGLLAIDKDTDLGLIDLTLGDDEGLQDLRSL